MRHPISLSLVVALAATVTACDTTTSDPEQKPSQRDVYSSVEDCIADWGDTDLCEKQMADAKDAAAKAAKASGGTGTNVAFVPLFFGPSYSPGERYAYNSTGQRVAPSTQRAQTTSTFYRNPRTGTVSSPPKYSTPHAATPKAAVAPTPTSRGGFGASGARGGGTAAS